MTETEAAQPALAMEPSNHLHRPTSAKTQDVGHILSKHFGEQFIREVIDPQVVQNLRVSQRGSSDPYHEEFLGKLLTVVDDRQRRLDRLAQLERSIMAAKARAMLADERLANRLHSGRAAGYPELGLPAPSSHFRSCLDAELMRANGLIGPTDLISRVPPPVPPPSAKSDELRRQQMQQSRQQKMRTANSAASGGSAGAASSKRSSRIWSATSQQLPHPTDRVEDLEEAAAAGETSRMSDGSFADKTVHRLTSPRQRKIDKLTKRKNLNWQEECSIEGRDEARKQLANLESRVNFLPNPKFLLPMETGGNGNLLTSKLVRDETDTRIFVSNPEKIVFTDYQIGLVYQQTLELRNVSCSLRYIRVIPPRTRYFSLSLGQFPGEQGQVAPGLCVRFDVAFAPDSLRDFEDEIAVETQALGSIVVKIEARRPRPVLNIPSELDVGQCLVYGSKTVFLRLKNNGGDGSFVILRADQWPATNLKRAVQGDSVTNGAFQLRPSVFELPRGATTTLEVTFVAGAAETFRSAFVLVCDNCQARELIVTGEGQRPAVEIKSVDPPGLGQPLPGESVDVGSDALIRFESAHPFTYCQRSLAIRNLANIELPFEWKVVKPFCQPPQLPAAAASSDNRSDGGALNAGSEAQKVQLPGHRTLDTESPFNVQPEFGLLAPNGSQEFVLTFAPEQVGQYHSALHLLLLEVPLRPSEAPQQQLLQNGALQALEMECKGVCEPFSVMLDPQVVQVPGDILVGTTIRQRLRLTNSSRAPVSFVWDSVADATSIVELEPRIGSVQAGGVAQIDLCLTATKPGQLDQSLACRVQHCDDPIVLRVLASVRGVQVQPQQPDVNFGLVEVGKPVELKIQLRNPYQLECNWTVSARSDCELRFEPAASRLGPLEEQAVTVKFLPSRAQTLNEIFRFDVENGESTFVSAFAEVQSPSVCILDAEKLSEIGDLYLDVRSAYTVQLYNQTRLRCKFDWQKARGPQAELCETSVEPQTGWLEPRQSMPITVFARPKVIGRLDSLLIPCVVEGQDYPVVIELSGQLKGISVSYHWSEEPLNSQTDEFRSAETEASAAAVTPVDFGTVAVHAVAKRYLHIRNNTSIRAAYSVQVEFFKAAQPESEIVLPMERSSKASAKRAGQSRKSLLTKTPNLADPKSKPFKHAFYDMCKAHLREDKGAAIHCAPSEGTLEAYAVTTVELIAYNDMWGAYDDNLLVSVAALPTRAIPLALKVEGCPVIFTMTAGRPDLQPILRFGSHTHGSKSVTRPVRLNNRSPFALRLDWHVFNVHTGDEQLLDFNCGFGRQFPPLDQNGDELLPPIPESSPQVSHRPPTGVLLDTPDSSAAPSRMDAFVVMETGRGTAAAEDQEESAKLLELRPVAVNVRPHEGRPASAPFTVSPAQLTLQPESYGYVNVTFDSNSIEHVSEAMDFNTYMLAFISLDEDRAQVPGKVFRGTGHSADQLRLDVTGSVVCPELDVDYNNDDAFSFFSAASDLLQTAPASASPGPLRTAFATLRNLRDTPLSFRLSLDAPFGLVQPRCGSAAEATQSGWPTACGPVHLAPRQTCLLEVGFAFDASILRSVGELTPVDHPEPDAATRSLTVNRETGERTMHFSGRLLMSFANGSEQSLPLSASLKFPSLMTNKTQLDFGVCMVGQRRELNFSLVNQTASGSQWNAKLVRLSDTCDPEKTFRFEPGNGFLEGNITYLSKNKILLRVFFTPKHAEEYSAEVEFRGLLEEEVKVVRIKGSGSYDEQYKTLYNE